MNWDNLKNLKCPKCRRPILRDLMYRKYKCTSCDFSISHEKFNEIVDRLYNKHRNHEIPDNAQAWNNDGREILEEEA